MGNGAATATGDWRGGVFTRVRPWGGRRWAAALPWRVLGVAAVAAALAGCGLGSKDPLLDVGDAVLPFGDRFVAIMEEDGRIRDENGRMSFLVGEAEGRTYRVTSPGQAGEVMLGVHPATDLPFDYILDVAGSGGEGHMYVAASGGDMRLDAWPVTLSGEALAALANSGMTLQKQGGGELVTAPEELLEALRAWSDATFATYEVPVRYRVWITPSVDPGSDFEALKTEALARLCLAQAGLYPSEEVLALPSRHAGGVLPKDIDASLAADACAGGDAADAPPAVRLARARVHLAAGENDAGLAIIDALVAADYGPAHIQKSYVLAGDRLGASDFDAALAVLERAAARHPVAAFVLAQQIRSGAHAHKGIQEAQRLYEFAIDAGFAPASTGLGILYADGKGVPKDEVRAIGLFREGVAGNDVSGYVRLGAAFAGGRGVDKDLAEGFRNMRVAADAGHVQAQYLAGVMLAKGLGTRRSDRAAIPYLYAASQSGDADAKAELGLMTYHGRGVPADRESGLRLIREAEAEGARRAGKYLAEIGAQSPP